MWIRCQIWTSGPLGAVEIEDPQQDEDGSVGKAWVPSACKSCMPRQTTCAGITIKSVVPRRREKKSPPPYGGRRGRTSPYAGLGLLVPGNGGSDDGASLPPPVSSSLPRCMHAWLCKAKSGRTSPSWQSDDAGVVWVWTVERAPANRPIAGLVEGIGTGDFRNPEGSVWSVP